jgi:hypothetical protein
MYGSYPPLFREFSTTFAGMKRLLLLFPIYILFLSGMPCSIDDDCCMGEMGTKTQIGQQTGKKDRKPEFPCSPFFACGANHGVVIPDSRLNIVQLEPPVIKLHSPYSEKPLFIFLSSVWQPPRVI